jgi:hypothetical protein
MIHTQFIGNLLIVYGPASAILFCYIYQIPQLVLITIASSFFYLVALTVSSFWYTVIKSTQQYIYLHIALGLIFSEITRILFIGLYKLTERKFKTIKRAPLLPSRFGYLHVGVGRFY